MTDLAANRLQMDAIRREAAEAFGIGLYGFTPDGVVLFMDAAAFHLMGLSHSHAGPQALTGQPLTALPGGEVHDGLCQQLRETGAVRGLEWAVNLPGGEVRWIFEEVRLVDASPDGPGIGQVYAQAVIRDISMRKHKEAALLADQSKYQHILENMREGYYEVDLEGRLVFLNRRLANLLGAAEERLLGSELIGRGGSPESEETHHRLMQALLAGEPVDALLDWTLHRADGRILELELSVAVRYDGQRQPMGLYGLCRDVTERKRAEAAAHAAEARYNQLFDEANDVIYTHNLDGRFTSLNKAGERLCGFSREEAYSMSVFDVIVPEQRDQVREMVQRKVVSAEMTQYELEIIARDGRRIPLEVSTRMLFEHGAPTGVLGIARDITERRQAEERHQRLEQRILHTQKLEGLGVLAGGIAHDFNNLLVGVLGNAGLALRRLPKDAPHYIYLKRIESAAQRASELTNQMLTYSGRSSFVVRPLNLSRIVTEMVDLIQASMPKTLEMRLMLAADLPLIIGDASQLQQAVMNLVTNAAEAIGDAPGRITISTRPCNVTVEYLQQVYFHESVEPGSYVCMEFTDTGCGMNEEQMARMFDPFYTTKFTGRGLGLAAILGIVRGHKGAIHVYSECGAGTTFKLLFPAAEEGVESPATPAADMADETEPEQDEAPCRGLILVADDEEAVRSVTHEILIRSGFDTLMACDGQEALDLFNRHMDRITGALIDLTMPRMNGQELMEQLRARRPLLPIIISSGYTEQDILERFHRERPSAFIQKPFRARDLMSLVRDVLHNPIIGKP